MENHYNAWAKNAGVRSMKHTTYHIEGSCRSMQHSAPYISGHRGENKAELLIV